MIALRFLTLSVLLALLAPHTVSGLSADAIVPEGYPSDADEDIALSDYADVDTVVPKTDSLLALSDLPCESWCATNAKDWETKCRWKKSCAGCPDCAAESAETPTTDA